MEMSSHSPIPVESLQNKPSTLQFAQPSPQKARTEDLGADDAPDLSYAPPLRHVRQARITDHPEPSGWDGLPMLAPVQQKNPEPYARNTAEAESGSGASAAPSVPVQPVKTHLPGHKNLPFPVSSPENKSDGPSAEDLSAAFE